MKTKVLMVEDDPNWLKIFQTLVGSATDELFDYVHVADLASAVQALRSTTFGLIFLDLMLPDSQGGNTIDVVRNEARDVPVIVITTLDDERLIQDAFKMGVDDYLVKDQYNSDVLVHVSRRALQKAMSKRQTGDMHEDMKTLLANMRALDERLEKWQNEE